MVNPSSGVSMAPYRQGSREGPSWEGDHGITANFVTRGGGPGTGRALFDKSPNPRYNAGRAKQGSRGFAQRSAAAQRQLIQDTRGRNQEAEVGGRELLGRYLASQGRSPAKDRMNSQMAMLRMMGIGV